MIRIGIYTGKTYSQEDYNNHSIKECCVVASPTVTAIQSIEDAKQKAAFKKILSCENCWGCEESQKDHSR